MFSNDPSGVVGETHATTPGVAGNIDGVCLETCVILQAKPVAPLNPAIATGSVAGRMLLTVRVPPEPTSVELFARTRMLSAGAVKDRQSATATMFRVWLSLNNVIEDPPSSYEADVGISRQPERRSFQMPIDLLVLGGCAEAPPAARMAISTTRL